MTDFHAGISGSNDHSVNGNVGVSHDFGNGVHGSIDANSHTPSNGHTDISYGGSVSWSPDAAFSLSSGTHFGLSGFEPCAGMSG